MSWTAKHRYARIAERKARLVADLIRGLPCDQAVETLRFTHKRAASLVDRVLKSAMASANEKEATMSKLVVTEARVDAGPIIKRFQPKDRGRAHSIFKRTSHIVISVDEKGEAVGQKCNPIGFRVGITEGWKSRWFAPKAAFGTFLVEDEHIRNFIDKSLNRQPPYAGIAKVEIERTRDEVKVILHTARPGMVIGAKGAEVDKLKEQLEDLIDRRVSVNIIEIKNPDINAFLVGCSIAEQLKKRMSFRRVMKQKCEAGMNAAKGIKIICSGRLGGAEMARVETQMLGSIPLQTLQAEVDYACIHAVTTVGTIGIKVWVYLGMYGEQPVERPEARFRGRFRR